ncbi:MAG: DUF2877 domain-containing protein [Anaerolineae bacterium]
MGVTSRGVFLAIEQQVLFVSIEHWRGPLTINVEGKLNCAIGDHVRLSPTRLIFPAFEVDLSSAAVWQPQPPVVTRSLEAQHVALKQLATAVIARKTPDGLGSLLPHVLDLLEKQALSASEGALLARLSQLRDAIQQSDFDQATALIEGLLGLGRGLTPSGDDVTIGLLLMLNRWQVDGNWRKLNQRVIDLAYQRTTTISANLIECAANGEADERLINVVDGIMTGKPELTECVECLLGWGNSSGVDALIGMALALSAV